MSVSPINPPAIMQTRSFVLVENTLIGHVIENSL